MIVSDWSVSSAKAHLSEVMDRALSEGPQLITRNGRKAVVVVSAEEWEKRTKRKGSIVEFFANSPLRGAKLKIERAKDGFRPIDL
jgi:prevent-host-death family protein